MNYPEPPAWKSWEPPTPGVDLGEWQAGRCAWCGWDRESLVRDHCHATGLVRGLLCRSCNQSEGGGGEAWGGWRNGDHPARAVGHIEVYSNHLGVTPLRWSTALAYYTKAEQEAWWVETCLALSEGGHWPTEAPWTPAATTRREADFAGMGDAISTLGTTLPPADTEEVSA